jgi:hypothetical protein
MLRSKHGILNKCRDVKDLISDNVENRFKALRSAYSTLARTINKPFNSFFFFSFSSSGRANWNSVDVLRGVSYVIGETLKRRKRRLDGVICLFNRVAILNCELIHSERVCVCGIKIRFPVLIGETQKITEALLIVIHTARR